MGTYFLCFIIAKLSAKVYNIEYGISRTKSSELRQCPLFWPGHNTNCEDTSVCGGKYKADTGTALDCMNLCQDTGDCSHWVWHKPESGSWALQCWLLTTSTQAYRNPDNNTVTGSCNDVTKKPAVIKEHTFDEQEKRIEAEKVTLEGKEDIGSIEYRSPVLSATSAPSSTTNRNILNHQAITRSSLKRPRPDVPYVCVSIASDGWMDESTEWDYNGDHLQ